MIRSCSFHNNPPLPLVKGKGIKGIGLTINYMLFSLGSVKSGCRRLEIKRVSKIDSAGLAMILGGVVGSICCSPEADQVLARLLRVPK